MDLPALVGTADEPTRRLPAKVGEPAPTPGAEACRELLARIRTVAAAAPLPPAQGDGKAEWAGERDLAANASAALNPLLLLLLVLAGGALIVIWLRSIPTRARDRQGQAGVEGV
jgi:hypothetical protein